jgi:hypothetical protein
MHRDLNPDPVAGQIVERNVWSFHAEFSFGPGVEVAFRPFLDDNHIITFLRSRSAEASGAARACLAPLASQTLHRGESPAAFPVAQADYCFDIAQAASSPSNLTPKPADV